MKIEMEERQKYMEDDYQELRKRKDNLIISGLAVLIVGLWDLVKYAMAMILNPQMLLEAVEEAGIEPGNEQIGEVILVLIFVMFLLVDILVRTYICKSARAEANGKKKGWFYLVVAAVLMLALISSLYTTLYNGVIVGLVNGTVDTGLPKSWDSVLASGLLDLITVIALGDIIVSSFIVKKIQKKDRIKNGEDI